MTPVRAPRCPGCDGMPLQLIPGVEIVPYFCSNDECDVVSWDPNDDPATFKAKATVFEWPPLGDYLD